MGASAAAERGSKNKTTGSLACLLPEGSELVPYMGRGWGYVQGPGQRAHLGVLPTLRWWCVQGACIVTAFAPNTVFASGSSKVTGGFFGLFVSFRSRICPKSHTVSLYFVAQGEVRPGASTEAQQQRVPDPSLSQGLGCWLLPGSAPHLTPARGGG